MTERRKSRRAFIADLLFLAGGVTAVALMGKFRASVDEPQPLTPNGDIADVDTQAQGLPPISVTIEDMVEDPTWFEIDREVGPFVELPREPYTAGYCGISGLLDR